MKKRSTPVNSACFAHRADTTNLYGLLVAFILISLYLPIFLFGNRAVK